VPCGASSLEAFTQSTTRTCQVKATNKTSTTCSATRASGTPAGALGGEGAGAAEARGEAESSALAWAAHSTRDRNSSMSRSTKSMLLKLMSRPRFESTIMRLTAILASSLRSAKRAGFRSV